jgi:hypothetical protein
MAATRCSHREQDPAYRPTRPPQAFDQHEYLHGRELGPLGIEEFMNKKAIRL